MSAWVDYAIACADRAPPSREILACLALLNLPPNMLSISGKPLPQINVKYCAWTVGVFCANAYAAAGPGFDRRFMAERNRQRKIAAKLGLDFSEYDNTETLVSGDCVRRQLLDSVPLAMERASRKEPND